MRKVRSVQYKKVVLDTAMALGSDIGKNTNLSLAHDSGAGQAWNEYSFEKIMIFIVN